MKAKIKFYEDYNPKNLGFVELYNYPDSSFSFCLVLYPNIFDCKKLTDYNRWIKAIAERVCYKSKEIKFMDTDCTRFINRR